MRTLLSLSAALVFASSTTASATFLGLDTGDLIQSVGFSIPGGGVSFTDTAATTGDVLTISAAADDVTTTTPVVLTEISGGVIDITLAVDSETLTSFGFGFFQYDAVLSGVGASPVNIYAPTGGPAAEQDGRLLASGDFSTSPTSTLSVIFDVNGGAPTFTVAGTFDVTGGDATFLQGFGMVGDLADILAVSSSSAPDLATLLADGHLFSERDDGAGGNLLTACAASITCSGAITGTQSWSGSGSGEIRPQSAAPFVPEPGTGILMSLGLLGLGVRARSRN